ncbi:DUF6395 domain-containing protein [Rothia sp. AR01]|uniref:DUF6395 domain-containing protein n=1 Tax=Rothia santali TaxID=2949643 RepID=A0A9X2KIU2_9MICC|nr:DUF6395 domain-containing protein [Rothia santali]MCP3426189.1 DUF6395 domain-containing protein [Rothia santali]
MLTGERATFAYELQGGDREVAGRATFLNRDFRIEEDLGATHPDLLVLIAYLGAAPWIGGVLECNVAASPSFARAVEEALSTHIVTVDPDQAPREAPENARPGLAYSGGADCSAALAVLPAETGAYFLDRIPREDGEWKGLYSKAAAHHACEELTRRGYLVRRVSTDLEFMRQPVGFPDDLSNVIPALCCADRDGLDAVGWGAILESTYRIGSKKFRDYDASPFVRTYGPVFEAVGLGVVNAVAGVSEVGTAVISHGSGFGDVVQSCMRGDVGKPCLKCWKCTRKVMLDSSLNGVWPAPDMLDELCGNREAKMRLTEDPIKHEGVVAFSVNRYDQSSGGSEIMGALQDKLATYDVEFLQRHYSPALDFMPPRYRDGVMEQLNDLLGPMTDEEEEVIRNWNVADHQSARRERGQERLRQILSSEEQH